ncbi:flagellar hook-associated protein FlgL [Bacillus sp. SM2101]|uniref:flagellar hook-associated protein FlgL n=1 Tax=Bacillus sp. SM2101 TaxID=2805366 RepID=UPI001BDE7B44|nr:flagellar hook-associated protein FlgL [Bacillus sp. SM2101]
MRVTQTMIADRSLRNISQGYSRLGELQDQLSTGKKITRPSDDPVVAMKGIAYRTNLTEVEQYQRNLSELYSWIENSEDGLDHANSALAQVRDLVLRGKNGSLSPEDQQAIADELSQIKEDLISVANTKVAGKYIYNGTAIDEAPVNAGPPIVANINTDAFNISVSNGVEMKANINADNVFSQALFDTIQDIEDSLNGLASGSGDFDTLLDEVDGHLDSLSAERSELGARYNRVELVEDRLAQQELIATKILSDNEDVDLERVIIDLTVQESVHRAALSVGASIMQPTLMDFLR